MKGGAVMKLIGIVGSPNGIKGKTAQLVKCVLQGAHAKNAETEIFSLADLTVSPCKGCGVCTKTGKCIIDDDIDIIKNAMIEADGIILASPNYMNNVSAQMKALMDRSHSLCHCQMMVGKYGAVVVTSGGPYTGMAEEYLLRILSMMGCWTVGSICAVKAQLDDEDERTRIMELAAYLGRQIVRSIENKEVFSEQVAERAEFFEALKFLIIKQKKNWSFEYEYWKTHWALREGEGMERDQSVRREKDMNRLGSQPR